MVNLRQEGWKGFKTGCVFEVTRRRAWDPKLQEGLERPQAIHNSYIAHVGGPERWGSWSGWQPAAAAAGCGRWTPWCWAMARRGSGIRPRIISTIVGRPAIGITPVSIHPWTMAHLLYGVGTPEARQWYRLQETLLFRGQADHLDSRFQAEAQTRPPACQSFLPRRGLFR